MFFSGGELGEGKQVACLRTIYIVWKSNYSGSAVRTSIVGIYVCQSIAAKNYELDDAFCTHKIEPIELNMEIAEYQQRKLEGILTFKDGKWTDIITDPSCPSPSCKCKEWQK